MRREGVGGEGPEGWGNGISQWNLSGTVDMELD